MLDHIPNEDYRQKQAILESVMMEEQEEMKVEEPWYIKIDGEGEVNVPVYKPQREFECTKN